MNVSGGNIAIGSVLSTLLLMQEGNDNVDGNMFNFLDSNSGINSIIPVTSEGLIVDTTTVISDPSLSGLSAGQLAQLNTLFGEYFTGETFATGTGAGPGSNFNFDFAAGSLDLIGSVNGPIIPAAISAVPEPNAAAIWGLLGLLTGFVLLAHAEFVDYFASHSANI